MFSLKIYISFANLILLTSAYYDEEPCKESKGTCVPTNLCPTKNTQNGLCPTQSSNIKCCVPYNESPCEARNGMCQWQSHECSGYRLSGLCPKQPGKVRCCISKSKGACEDKYEHALKEIFRFEGKCQNSASDKGNHLQGKVGYTCMGITPGVGWKNRKLFPSCIEYKGHASAFVKHCYDRQVETFKHGAGQIYRKQYLNTCSALSEPAFFVCADIAVNSGTSRVRRFMKSLGKQGNDIKEYARKLNKLHRAFYKKITRRNHNYKKFLKGWLRRADERDYYINSYQC